MKKKEAHFSHQIHFDAWYTVLINICHNRDAIFFFCRLSWWIFTASIWIRFCHSNIIWIMIIPLFFSLDFLSLKSFHFIQFWCKWKKLFLRYSSILEIIRRMNLGNDYTILNRNRFFMHLNFNLNSKFLSSICVPEEAYSFSH